MDRREYDRNRYHERRKLLINLLGDECAICGSTSELEIDHIDPTTKSFDMGKCWTKPFNLLLEELTKCQALCKSCHKEKSDLEEVKPIQHGTIHAYFNKRCRCDECVLAGSIYKKKLRASKASRIGVNG